MAPSPKLLTEGEEVILSTRTHAKALVWPAIVLIVTAAIVGLLWGVIPDGGMQTALRVAVVAVGLVIIVWRVLIPFLNYMTTTYSVTNRRLIEQTGILTRKGRVIPLNRINDVAYEKELLDRILGCGTLIVHDASEQAGLRLPDVPKVESVHRTLSTLVWKAHDGSDDDGTPGPTRGPEPTA